MFWSPLITIYMKNNDLRQALILAITSASGMIAAYCLIKIILKPDIWNQNMKLVYLGMALFTLAGFILFLCIRKNGFIWKAFNG